MKKALLLFILLCVLIGCNTDDSALDNNPNLVDLGFTRDYNLTLPQYNQLNFPGNQLQDYSVGISGINIFYIGNDQYRVFELTDPNHQVSDCSTLIVTQGLTARCQCEDGNEYNLNSGEQTAGEGGQYILRQYRARLNGDILTVSN